MSDPITSATSATTTATAATASGQSDGAVTDAALADYDDFLTLLTTQLKNQDPLNPSDSTEFVEQIATFTTVEQQMNANERLDQLIAATLAQSVSDLASWVGMEVSAPGLAFSFDGAELAIEGLQDTSAQSAKALIKDENGATIAEIAYDPKQQGELSWDGTRSDGQQAPAGSYFVEFEVTKLDDDGNPQVEKFTSADFARVTEARMVDGKPSLILSNGYIMQADQVTAVRSPTG